MDGPGDYHTKWSKSEREKLISYDIAFMRNLDKGYKWAYLENRNRLIDLESEPGVIMITRAKGRGGQIDREFGTEMYTLFYLR